MLSIGIDLGGTSAKIAVISQDEVVKKITERINDASSFASTFEQLSPLLHQLISEHGDQESLQSIGLTLPSLVDSKKNQVLSDYVKFSDARDINLNELIQNEFETRLFLENDAKAALVGECNFGAAKGALNVAMLTFGTGIGSAVIIDGKLISGQNHAAGNLLGHTIINHKGEPCNCNGHGCVEKEASSWMIEDFFNSDVKYSDYVGTGFKGLMELNEKGDEQSIDLFENMISVWKAVVINTVHCFDPQFIILGGGMMSARMDALPLLQDAINEHCWTPNDSNRVVMAQLGGYAGAIGAACLHLGKS